MALQRNEHESKHWNRPHARLTSPQDICYLARRHGHSEEGLKVSVNMPRHNIKMCKKHTHVKCLTRSLQAKTVFSSSSCNVSEESPRLFLVLVLSGERLGLAIGVGTAKWVLNASWWLLSYR